MREKERIVKGVVVGMETRLQATGVRVVIGVAKLASPNEVEIAFDNGTKEMVKTKKIIIATGSLARRYPIPGAYDSGVLTTKQLLDLSELPKSLAIIGRSVTALELATVWVNLGCDVSLIARRPQFLPGEDEELATYIRQRIDDCEEGKSITISGGGLKQKVTAQCVVFALGQQPLVDGLGLENAGIAVADGGIRTNEKMETSVKGILAAGDVTGEIMLASVAMIQGMVAANNSMGRDSTIDYHVVPRSVRTIPPIAAVGITESEAKERGLEIKVGRFPFEQNVKANILREPRGFVKIIADSASGEILGAHVIGPHATELIHEVVVVMKMRGTVQDVAAVIHSHPSLHETIQRAAQELCI